MIIFYSSIFCCLFRNNGTAADADEPNAETKFCRDVGPGINALGEEFFIKLDKIYKEREPIADSNENFVGCIFEQKWTIGSSQGEW